MNETVKATIYVSSGVVLGLWISAAESERGRGSVFQATPAASSEPPSLHPLDRLYAAIIQVESGGNPNAPDGKAGEVGIAQIRPIMVRECNRIVGAERWSLDDRKDPAKSREMFNTYIEHWQRGRSLEWAARAWNGGPTWHKSKRQVYLTSGYWRKVRAELKGEQR